MSNKNSKQFCPSNFDILYQDQWIVVINKPEGLLSVPYPGCSQKTAINILEEIMRKKGLANSKHHPFAVHRLDRDTSGGMMFALSKSIQQKIMNNWQKMVTERLYRCLSEITKNADILIAALGKAKFVTADMVKDGAVIIDVGINRNEEGKLVGDVDFENVEKKASYITPVPGGVGPMTIAMLMTNVVKAAKEMNK